MTQDTEQTGRLVMLDAFPSLLKAQIMRSRLESEGITVSIPREQFASPEGTEVSILVPAFQLKQARTIIDRVNRGDFAIDDGEGLRSESSESPTDTADLGFQLTGSRDGSAQKRDERAGSSSTVLGVAHIVLAVLSAFVLLSQQHWDIAAISGRNGGRIITAVAFLGIAPYVISWGICRTSVPNGLRTWTYVGILGATTVLADIAYALNSLGWMGSVGVAVAQSIANVFMASVVRKEID